MQKDELVRRIERKNSDPVHIMAAAYVHAIACEGYHTHPDACRRRMQTVIARLADAGMVIVPIEPTPAMIDSFVARALQVTVAGEGGWSDYARNQWKQMLAALRASNEGEGE